MTSLTQASKGHILGVAAASFNRNIHQARAMNYLYPLEGIIGMMTT